MNDRYLFRGKRVDGIKRDFAIGHYVSTPRPMIVSTKSRIGGGWDADDVDPSTVGQCTGLRDKNGKLVFEGDIVKYPHIEGLDDMFQQELDVVMFSAHDVQTASGEIIRGFYFLNWERCEIIGNIHDNPELLEV